jgi:hypothetical protein
MTNRMQVRTSWGQQGVMHIQGVVENIEGNDSNRPYGIALDVNIGTEILEWLGQQVPILESGADGKSESYIPLEMYENDGEPRLLLKGDGLNHKDGAVIGLDLESLVITSIYNFVIDNDLLFNQTLVSLSEAQSSDDSSLSEGDE